MLYIIAVYIKECAMCKADVAFKAWRLFCNIYVALSNRLSRGGMTPDILVEIVESNGERGVDKLSPKVRSEITPPVLQDMIFCYREAEKEILPKEEPKEEPTEAPAS